MTGPRDRFFAAVLSFGWFLPAALAVGAGAGWVVDRLLGSFPVATAVLTGLGFVAGLREILQASEKLSRDTGPDDPGGGDGGK